MTATCPIEVHIFGLWIGCRFPPGHDPWLHSWQTPGESPFYMAPPVSDVRNRDGGPLGYPYDDEEVTVRRSDLRAMLAANGTIPDDVYDRLAAAAGEVR